MVKDGEFEANVLGSIPGVLLLYFFLEYSLQIQHITLLRVHLALPIIHLLDPSPARSNAQHMQAHDRPSEDGLTESGTIL